MDEKYVDIELPEKTTEKLKETLKELQQKGVKLKNGKTPETENDVLTYLLDLYEEKYGKLT